MDLLTPLATNDEEGRAIFEMRESVEHTGTVSMTS